MGTYLPHTEEDVASMLSFLGLPSTEALFSAVPESIRLQHGLELDDGVTEPDVLAHFEGLAAANRARCDQMICFAGGGVYDHEVPPVTRALAGRSEFVTSYTPYQPEVAQGVLQALFEYQTLVARLSGLPVANASLYDGGSATVEAVNLGVGASGRSLVWVSQGIHPNWRSMLTTYGHGTGHQVRTVPLTDGVTRWPDVDGDGPPGVVVLAYPNYLGCIDDVAAARRLCDRTGATLVVAADPVAAGLMRSAGSWGADVVVGEGQVFGMPLSFGGPALGLFTCTEEHLRRLPGRLVGETVDVDGKRAYVTTLRAREQDIRREKAASNVCTNQTLMAVTAAVQLAWLGTQGLAEMGHRCASATHYARAALFSDGRLEPFVSASVLREFAVRLPVPAEVVVERMANEGFLAGIPLDGEFEGGEHGLLVAVTERRTRDEIDAFVAALTKAAR
ncbi:MAG: aminomethyl-transferring glycine dehydrogenase subunit GcvPA [Acidimicrobiales bacterium]